MYTQQLCHLKVADVDEMIERLEKQNVKRYAVIVHDKDIDENGQPVEAHVHAMMTFANARSSSGVAKMFDDQAQYVEIMDKKDKDGKRTDPRNGYAYLVHQTRGALSKYQYSPSDVITNFDYIGL